MSIVPRAVATHAAWNFLRDHRNNDAIEQIIHTCSPTVIIDLHRLASSHFAVYIATLEDNSQWIIRVGAIARTDLLQADNSDFLDTSIYVPTGQLRELVISNQLVDQGAHVIALKNIITTGDYDISWSPFVQHQPGTITLSQWKETICSVHRFNSDLDMESFTDRAIIMQELQLLPRSLTTELQQEYDDRLNRLFDCASTWGTVHGNARQQSIIHTGKHPVFYNLRSVCHAPIAWDVASLIMDSFHHLQDTSFEALCDFFNLSGTEVHAALRLRKLSDAIKFGKIFL